jgi:peptidoglycan/xylan/chitin deacetylase (PgdA/CDA1 family)
VTKEKPICSLSLDLDNQWSYMKTHGDSGWESFPSFLDLVVPRFLKILDDLGWKITVFVVGQDAALEKNQESLQMIADAGHEIGNHSFSHDPWLHLYSRQQVEDEIARAEEAIENATSQHPRGFRGPGYSLSRDVLEVLAERDYLYDGSTFPTFLGPLARAYYFLKSDFSRDEKAKRKQLFGGIRNGIQPLSPYFWGVDSNSILEIPVTTTPVLKTPFHFSYQLYLATFSPALSRLYFRTALAMCRLRGIEPSLLLHPLDFLGCTDTPELLFFPSMNLEAPYKVDLLKDLLRLVEQNYTVVNMREHHRIGSKRVLPSRQMPRDLRLKPSATDPG